ncbi:MAG TPA: hypothetical protein VMC78_02790 [Mycobacterium sp.]|nr:hypothetical protein [Mycobacterium sp.]
MYPGAEEIGGSVDLDYSGAGAPEFLGDRLRERIITGDDDLAVHDLARLTGNGVRVRWMVRPSLNPKTRIMWSWLCVLRHNCSTFDDNRVHPRVAGHMTIGHHDG